MTEELVFNLARLERESFVSSVVYEREMSSTSDRARELIQQMGAKGKIAETPVLVLADRQTAGRGRGAHRWWSSAGSLTFSLIFREELTGLAPEELPKLSITSALAVLDTLVEHVPAEALELRWPNDVYAGGRKIAGILPEVIASQGSVALVLGIGLNVNNRLDDAPEEIQAVATSVINWTDEPLCATETLLRLLHGLQQQFLRLLRRDPTLPDDWNRWFRLTGRRISLDSAGKQYTGRCCGIDARGRLGLESGGRVERFHSGTSVRPLDG